MNAFPTLNDPNRAAATPELSTAAHAGEGLQRMRIGIWVYLFLLLFEGALRKWILPSYSNHLLFVREPVVIAIYIWAVRAGVFPRHRMCLLLLLLGGISVVIGGFTNSRYPLITLYGLKANFL